METLDHMMSLAITEEYVTMVVGATSGSEDGGSVGKKWRR